MAEDCADRETGTTLQSIFYHLKTRTVKFNEYRYLIDMADEHIRNEKFEEAALLLENLLFEEPAFGMAHGYLGWLYDNKLDNRKRAVMHYKYSMRFDPDFAGAYLNYAHMMYRSGEYGEAIGLYESAMKVRNIDKAFLYERVGLCHEEVGDLNEAISAYREAAREAYDPYDYKQMRNHVRRVRAKRRRALFKQLLH